MAVVSTGTGGLGVQSPTNPTGVKVPVYTGPTGDTGAAISTPPVTPPDVAATNIPYTQPSGAPASITTQAGFTPDYTALIQNDPAYASAIATNQDNASSAAAQRRAALQSATIQYGGLPSSFKDAYGDIDQATLDAARNNPYSTLGQLQRNYQQSVEQFRKALAARGALQSGDLNYGQDQLDTGYGQSQYDAANAFGGQATGAINQYAGVLNDNQRALVNAIGTASNDVYTDPLNRPVTAKTATHDEALSAQYGIPLYTDGSGTMWTQDGNVFDPTNPSGAAYSSAPAAPYGYGIGRVYTG